MDDLENKISQLLSSPDGMEQIMSVARALSSSAPENEGEADKDAPSPEAPVFDAKLLGRLASLTSPPSDDKKTALLNALKPYLSKQRQEKLDRAMNLLRMTKLAKAALSEGGLGDV